MRNAICIEHGETTCAVEPGNFCMFVGTRSFGTRAVCMLFNEQPLFEDYPNGWLQRCPQCLKIFTGERIVTKDSL